MADSDPKRLILARRARFVALALASAETAGLVQLGSSSLCAV